MSPELDVAHQRQLAARTPWREVTALQGPVAKCTDLLLQKLKLKEGHGRWTPPTIEAFALQLSAIAKMQPQCNAQL